MKIILPIIMSRLLVMFEVIILNDEWIMWSLTGSSRLKEFLDRLIVSRRWLFHFYVRCTDSNLCSGWWALFPSHYIILLVRWYVILLRIKKEKKILIIPWTIAVDRITPEPQKQDILHPQLANRTANTPPIRGCFGRT